MSLEISGWARVTQKPKIKEVGNTKVAEISVVENEVVGKDDKKKEITSFFELECWDSAAEYIENNLDKGDMLSFKARPRQDKWTDKETGLPRSKIVFRVLSFYITKKQPKAE